MARVKPKGRPRRTGVGRHVQQYKLNAESVEKKIAVLKFHAQVKKMRVTINHFYPTLATEAYQSKRTQIQRWITERPKFDAAISDNKGAHKKLREVGVGTILSKELEEDIVVWVNDLREEGVPVSPSMLEVKTREVAKAAGIEGFEASDKWALGFKRRHGFSLRAPTRQGQMYPPYLAAIAAEFSIRVTLLMQQLGITRVYNADQTAVFFFKYVAKKTISKRGERTVWVRSSGASKERVTVTLLGDSDGNKYAHFVVVKACPSTVEKTKEKNLKDRNGFGARIWQEVRPILAQSGLIVHGNKKGWWNQDLSVQFLRRHFGHRSVPFEPILLLWDDFNGHWTDQARQYAASINVVLMGVPPKATSVSQPADVAWNFPFKASLRRLWHADMKTQIMQPRIPDTTFKLKPPDRAKICGWIQQSWSSLSADTISNGFRACNLQPSDSCVVESELISDLEKLSLLDDAAVAADQDFSYHDV